MSDAEPADPRLWLEEVDSERALDWVRARNAETLTTFGGEAFDELQARLRAIYDADDKIPFVTERGGWLYNFWQDEASPRGVWRRTTRASYETDAPAWDVLLDVDQLNADEDANWVFKGIRSLPPAHDRVLVLLSRGGADAVVVREFDVPSRSFVADGFALPEAKQSAEWIDHDTLFVARDFGDGGTTSGYPRQVKRWRRGHPLATADLVYDGDPSHIIVSAAADHTEGFERQWVRCSPTFFTSRLWEVRDTRLHEVAKPLSASASVYRDRLLFELRDDWTHEGTTHPAGSLLVTSYEAWMRGDGVLTALFTPTATTSLAGWGVTRRHVFLDVLDDVKSRVEVLAVDGAAWRRRRLKGLPTMGNLSVSAVDPDRGGPGDTEGLGDEVWITATGYLTPTTLWRANLLTGELRELKASPRWFDASPYEVTQHFVASADGTRIPYFQVGPKGGEKGASPTLLYGYGGFEVSQLPFYSGTVGRGWLERGGTYVVANIRGGGEYGPRWHQAALRDQRHRAYEDFVAVARDLVARGVTTPAKLGIRGGSNGGLLMGNMITLYPSDFGAVHCAVPLLDMRRFHRLLAGASWVGEYGDPDDPDDWAFLRTFSPYHNIDPDGLYPPILFTTSTRDDRVHPGHARKMAHALIEAGHDVAYYENIEGGHGGAADNEQTARLMALTFTYLWEKLGG